MSELITTDDVKHEAPTGALVDLRAHAMNVPAERMQAALAEYTERRTAFREWLLGQLTEGLHYGYVPGTEPSFDSAGNTISRQWDKRQNDNKGGYKNVTVSPKSWRAKRCLYKAGAEFVVDLMGVRAQYAADVPAWQQLGSAPGNFVIKCTLVSRATEELIGEGIGARKVGTKGGDENNAVKMAQKAALVAAVLNSYGLSDLFTQDIDDAPPKHDNPEGDAAAPKSPPRAKRGEDNKRKEVVGSIYSAWLGQKADQAKINGDPATAKALFTEWVGSVAQRSFNPAKWAEWNDDDIDRCKITLGMEG